MCGDTIFKSRNSKYIQTLIIYLIVKLLKLNKTTTLSRTINKL